VSAAQGTSGSGGTPEASRGTVVHDGEYGLPYSKGLTANTVVASGLSPVRAYRIAEVVEERLRALGRSDIEAEELRRITIEVIREEAGDRYADAYRKWVFASSLDVPLIILIGGGTGAGKSTIATQLAARLGIVRVISTDAVREVMKSVFSYEFMPFLHVSSFDAGHVARGKGARADEAILSGFRDQVAAVSVGVKALVDRAVREGTDVIVEGAHLAPGFIDFTEFLGSAVVVPLVLQVEDESLHRSHFHMRAQETRARPVERYLAHFENIRKIQKYIKSLALQNGVPIISNYNLDACLASVIDHVVNRAVEAAGAGAQDQGDPAIAIRGGSE